MTECIQLPYYSDNAHYFSVIHHRFMAVLLDSCHAQGAKGRYDIMSAQPYCTLTHWSDHTEVTLENKTYQRYEDPFVLIEEYLGSTIESTDDLPFCGGAIGFLAYDLGWRLEHLPPLNPNEWNAPEMIIGIYDWALIIDHHLKKSTLVAQHRCQETKARIAQLATLWKEPTKQPLLKTLQVKLEPDISQSNYQTAFDKIKQHILVGNCYQANLSQRFTGPFNGDCWSLYRQIRNKNPAPFSAYLNYNHFKILSISPEKFITVKQGQVITQPVKGTRPRHSNPEIDQALGRELQNNAKEQAENVMIVDLLRNDISKNCKVNSVQVSRLCELVSYPAVHHLVSTITGTLANNSSCLDLLRSCFPGGSITGAPKIRAMEIINQVETHRRTIYCGSIVAISFDHHLHSNICIRTLLQQQNQLYCWAGSAIVADSICDAEYEECFAKIRLILESLT